MKQKKKLYTKVHIRRIEQSNTDIIVAYINSKYVLEYWYIGGSCCSCHLSGHRNDVYQILYGFKSEKAWITCSWQVLLMNGSNIMKS